MDFNFTEAIEGLSSRQQLSFYELFAHQLTVAMRGVLFTEGLDDAERTDRAKWINEIAHRITFDVFLLRKNVRQWTEPEIWQMIEQNVGKNPAIGEAVNSAVEMSYKYVLQNEMENEQ